MPTPGPRTTPRYSAQFKATAVRLSQRPGVAVQDGGCHLPQGGRRLALPGNRDGPPQPPPAGLGTGYRAHRGADRTGAAVGITRTETRGRSDLPQRSRRGVPRGGVPASPGGRRPTPERQPATPDERQCPHGILEQIPQVGHVPPSAICHGPGTAAGGFGVCRFLQPPALTLRSGIPNPVRVRGTMHLTTGCPLLRRKSRSLCGST